MLRKIFYSIFIFLFFSTAESSNAFFKTISSPCGCGRFQAGRDASHALRNEGKMLQKFERCLSCRKIKIFSDIAPYLRAFFIQLPETLHGPCATILKRLKWPPAPQLTYDQILLNQAYNTWQYTPQAYKMLRTGGDEANHAKQAQGPNGKLWKFLYSLRSAKSSTDILRKSA